MEDNLKPPVPTSDDIRDELARVLHTVITSGVPVKDEETGTVSLQPPPAAYLAVARAYLKDHPPATLPAAGSPTGLLKKHMEGLPFGGAKGKH